MKYLVITITHRLLWPGEVVPVYIYQPLLTEGQFCKRILTGLNSEFTFSKISFLNKGKEPSLPYYLPITGRENNWIHTFPKSITAMWKATIRVQDLNSYRHVHFLQR